MKRVFIIITILLSVVIFTGCSKAESIEYEPNNYTDTDSNPVEPVSEVVVPELNGGVVVQESSIPELQNRKIIYSADLEMEAPAPKQIYNQILGIVQSYTAYIEASNIKEDVIVIRIRVLTTEFNDFIDAVKLTGDIISFESSSQDITNEYNALEARQTALLSHQTRLLELIAEASFTEMMQLMDELEDVEAELIDIDIQLSTYNSLIDYSTLEVVIKKTVEVELIAPRTSLPSVYISEKEKDSFVVDVYNSDGNSVTINLDLYKNGEFVREYSEIALPDSETSFVIGELESNTEYKIKVTVVAEDHRASQEVSVSAKTEPTYFNNIGNTFNESMNLLFSIVKGIGYVIVALLPFAVVGGVGMFGYKLLIKKYPKFKIKKAKVISHQNTEPTKKVSN